MSAANHAHSAFPDFALRPLDGRTEDRLAAMAGSDLPRPIKVTQVLSLVLSRIGSQAVDRDVVRKLPAATREWLLQQFAACLSPGRHWFESRCVHCGENYDAWVDIASMPRKEPGYGYPSPDVRTSAGHLRLEVPKGWHEEQIASEGGNAGRLADLCIVGGRACDLGQDDYAAIDAALDEASPDVADCAESQCPACGNVTTARLDPLTFALPTVDGLVREVHAIASAYGWTEAVILRMQSSRRRRYLSLIEGENRRGRPLRISP